jgi:hypothetical protein
MPRLPGRARVVGGDETALRDLYMKCLEPAPKPKWVPTEEWQAKAEVAVKEYTRRMWQRRVHLDKDANRKIKLKWAAIAALPTPELQRAALTIDETDTGVPLERHAMTDTPPHRGWNWDVDADTLIKLRRERAAEAGDGSVPMRGDALSTEGEGAAAAAAAAADAAAQQAAADAAASASAVDAAEAAAHLIDDSELDDIFGDDDEEDDDDDL